MKHVHGDVRAKSAVGSENNIQTAVASLVSPLGTPPPNRSIRLVILQDKKFHFDLPVHPNLSSRIIPIPIITLPAHQRSSRSRTSTCA
jgi:hypothetical protein